MVVIWIVSLNVLYVFFNSCFGIDETACVLLGVFCVQTIILQAAPIAHVQIQHNQYPII